MTTARRFPGRRLSPVLLTVAAFAAATTAPSAPAAASPAAAVAAVTPAAAAAPAAPSEAATPVPGQVAAASTAAARPRVADLGFDAAVDDVLLVGSTLWVSHDDVVDVIDTGTGEVAPSPITLTGAGDLALAPTADRVFVSSATGIAVYDVTTRNQLADWATSEPCPRHPTPFGDLLLYAFGCPGTGPYGIGGLDPATGTPAATGLGDSYAAAPRLLAAQGVLVTVEEAGTVTLRSRLLEGDGSVTSLASSTVAGLTDLALAADGSELVLATGGTVTRLDTADLVALAGSTPVGAPSAVATDPDGGSFAYGVTGSSTDQLVVRDRSTGDPVSRSAERSAATGAANQAVLAGTLVYAGDGSLLHALTRPPGGHLQLLTATARPVQVSAVRLQLVAPRRFGDPLSVRVLVPGRAGSAVRLVLVDAGGSATYPGPAVLNGAGRLVVPAEVELNGRIIASVGADLTHAAGTTSRSFGVPAALQVGLSGSSGRRGGVLRFRSFAAIDGLVSGLPSRTLRVTIWMQQQTRGRWRTAVPAQAASTDGNGLLAITVGQFSRGTKYRLVARFTGDSRNRPAPIAFSPPFVVG